MCKENFKIRNDKILFKIDYVTKRLRLDITNKKRDVKKTLIQNLKF